MSCPILGLGCGLVVEFCIFFRGLSRFSRFLPKLCRMWIGDCNCSQCIQVCNCVCSKCSTMDWHPIHVVFLPHTNWGRTKIKWVLKMNEYILNNDCVDLYLCLYY